MKTCKNCGHDKKKHSFGPAVYCSGTLKLACECKKFEEENVCVKCGKDVKIGFCHNCQRCYDCLKDKCEKFEAESIPLERSKKGESIPPQKKGCGKTIKFHKGLHCFCGYCGLCSECSAEKNHSPRQGRKCRHNENENKCPLCKKLKHLKNYSPFENDYSGKSICSVKQKGKSSDEALALISSGDFNLSEKIVDGLNIDIRRSKKNEK